MERLLAFHNIQSVSYIDPDGSQYLYAYTPGMLSRRLFIELAQHEIGEEDNPEYETTISAFTIENDISYEFYLLYDDRPVVSPLYLCHVIIDCVEYIYRSSERELFENLGQIATGNSISNEIIDKKLRIQLHTAVEEKIDLVLQLIENKNAGSN